jgi:quinol monooxygenase YgiN
MIVSTLRMTSTPERRGAVLHAIRSTLGPTAVQPGFLGWRLYHDIGDANAITFAAEWRSQEDLDRHLRSAQYTTVLAVMEMSTERPELTFRTVTHTAGIETVIAARSKDSPFGATGIADHRRGPRSRTPRGTTKH